MDLKIKKYFIEATPGGPSDHHDDEQGGGSTVERKLIADSKFRRETSNFKVNYDMTNVDPESTGPVLIKYIEKNLKPEELLGVVFTIETSEGSKTADIALVQKFVGEFPFDIYVMTCGMDTNIPGFYYVPSTGALSMNAPYVESEEGGENPRKSDQP